MTHRRELATFYLLSLALSWPTVLFWHLPPDFQFGDSRSAREAYGQVDLFFGVGPMLAALIATFVYRRTPGIVALLRRAFAWRLPLLWYLVALVIPIIPQWLGIGTWSAIDGVDLNLYSSTVWLSRWIQISIFGGLFSVGEELGWRGFMLPRVQEGRSWLSASLIVGLLWTVWHYPLWFIGAWAATGSVAKTVLLLAIASVGAVGMSVLVTWIFNHSKYSVLPAMLLHGSANANMYIFYERAGEQAPTSVTLLICTTSFIVLTAACVALSGRRTPLPLTPPRYE